MQALFLNKTTKQRLYSLVFPSESQNPAFWREFQSKTGVLPSSEPLRADCGGCFGAAGLCIPIL